MNPESKGLTLPRFNGTASSENLNFLASEHTCNFSRSVLQPKYALRGVSIARRKGIEVWP